MNRIVNQADQQLRLLVSLVTLLGLSTVVVAAVITDFTALPPHWVVLVTVLLLVTVGDFLNVEIRIRSTRHGSAWADAAVLIGLAVLPGPWVVLVTAAGTAAARVVRRVSPIKFAFAVAKESLLAAAGATVLLFLGVTGSMESPVAFGYLALAFVVMTLIDPLISVPVIALASKTPILERLRTNLDIRLLMAAGRFAIVVLAVLALQLDPFFLYMLPIVVLIAHLWHERWVRTREEREAWQNLAAATEAFTGVDLDEVIHAAVKGGARLFSADEIEVETWLGLDRRLVRGSTHEVTYDGHAAGAPADHANVYAIALHGYPGRRDIGALRLRFHGEVRMSDREHAMLASYAASLDTAIRNAAAYGQLGEATQAHARAAAHDPLTGLANRRELERVLGEALETDQSLGCRIALLMIDLKHFKEVNDTLGHLTGDQVLRQIATRLADSVGDNDLAARFGGDEFAVVLGSAFRTERVRARAERVLAALTEPVEVDGLPLVVEAHAGLALAVDPQEEAEAPPAYRATATEWVAELMRRADVAMYQAKRSSQRLVCYTPAGDTTDRERLALAGQLSRAVSQREFVLHFQPIVHLATGDVHGAEALARWRHPTRGQLAPRWFLDLLERSNHLQEFTAAVLDDALSAADLWRAAGHDLSVSVNISARSLLDGNLPRMVLDALSAHDTPADRLCLELTETLAISQLEVVDRVLTQLHDLGVRLALDDFGTGYSSLSALSRIPVHQLKVDRSFVQQLQEPWPGDPADQDAQRDQTDQTDHTGQTDHPGQESQDSRGDPGGPAGPVDPAGDADPAGRAGGLSHARAVIRSTIQLGRTLDLTVVAEGIEYTRQRRQLLAMGCAFGQGNMYAAPLPADQFLAYLTRGAADRPQPPADEPLTGDGKVIRLPARAPDRPAADPPAPRPPGRAAPAGDPTGEAPDPTADPPGGADGTGDAVGNGDETAGGQRGRDAQ